MAIGDGVSGEGRTLREWDPDVERVVQRLFNRFSDIDVVTYECHPFCGWERRSLDVWDSAGRGFPLRRALSVNVLHFLFNLPGRPLIRHSILEHNLWVRGVGDLHWARDDHSGRLRHVHVTYLPVPEPG